MEKEIWKDVKGYEGYYQVSNIGRARSLTRKVRHHLGGLKTAYGSIKALNVGSNGYIVISLHKDGKHKCFSIHTLIWDHFGNKKRNGINLQVDHKDGNKINNHINNLHLLTPSQNTQKYYNTVETTSKYPRVHFEKRNNKWRASLRINGKNKHIGMFNTEEEANQANIEFKKNQALIDARQ